MPRVPEEARVLPGEEPAHRVAGRGERDGGRAPSAREAGLERAREELDLRERDLGPEGELGHGRGARERLEDRERPPELVAQRRFEPGRVSDLREAPLELELAPLGGGEARRSRRLRVEARRRRGLSLLEEPVRDLRAARPQGRAPPLDRHRLEARARAPRVEDDARARGHVERDQVAVLEERLAVHREPERRALALDLDPVEPPRHGAGPRPLEEGDAASLARELRERVPARPEAEEVTRVLVAELPGEELDREVAAIAFERRQEPSEQGDAHVPLDGRGEREARRTAAPLELAARDAPGPLERLPAPERPPRVRRKASDRLPGAALGDPLAHERSGRGHGERGEAGHEERGPPPPRPARETLPRRDRPRLDRLLEPRAREVLREREGARVALAGLGGERAQDDRLERDGQRRHAPPRRDPLGGGRRDEVVHRDARGRDRRQARHELVQDRPERVDVGAHVHLLAPRLLGSHVGRRPEHVARRRDLGPVEPARQAEVRHERLSLGREEDVRGLEVPVDDAALVRVRDGARHLLDEEERALGRDAREGGVLPLLLRAPDDARERATGREVHDDEPSAGGLAHVMDAHDVRVVERGDRARLLDEAGDLMLGAALEELERDDLPERRVARAVDRPAAAPPEELEQLVDADRASPARALARREGRPPDLGRVVRVHREDASRLRPSRASACSGTSERGSSSSRHRS